MDPGGTYNLAEIWPFPINGGANVHSSMRSGVSNLISGDPARMSHALSQAVVGGISGARKRRDAAEDKLVSAGDGNDAKTSGCGEEQVCDGKAETGGRLDGKKQLLEPPKDYIHVRARRGQATDSHSLAERARREKISERMKILQDLVPGCNKVIGKALVLDEIINYIQSLQGQVEFLSMKLEAVNSRMNPGIEAFPPKEFDQQPFENPGMQFSSQATREYNRGASPEWLHMQVGGGFERTS